MVIRRSKTRFLCKRPICSPPALRVLCQCFFRFPLPSESKSRKTPCIMKVFVANVEQIEKGKNQRLIEVYRLSFRWSRCEYRYIRSVKVLGAFVPPSYAWCSCFPCLSLSSPQTLLLISNTVSNPSRPFFAFCPNRSTVASSIFRFTACHPPHSAVILASCLNWVFGGSAGAFFRGW